MSEYRILIATRDNGEQLFFIQRKQRHYLFWRKWRTVKPLFVCITDYYYTLREAQRDIENRPKNPIPENVKLQIYQP